VAYYFSLALSNLGTPVAVITKLAEADSHLLDELAERDIPFIRGKATATTTFENIYPGKSLDFRIQRIRAVAEPFTLGDVRRARADIFHLGPLTPKEIPLDILVQLAQRGKVSLDVQGYLRRVRGQLIEQQDWAEKVQGLAHVDILKTDEIEARILSGRHDIPQAAAKLSEFGPQEVIITLGSRGSVIYSEGKLFRVPAFPPRRLVDATGCGDTYMAGYVHKRLDCDDLEKVGRFAAATASLKLERFGPSQASQADVDEFLKMVGRHR
jgi:sugar/nucleoside kinase (ribokinase family)